MVKSPTLKTVNIMAITMSVTLVKITINLSTGISSWCWCPNLPTFLQRYGWTREYNRQTSIVYTYLGEHNIPDYFSQKQSVVHAGTCYFNRSKESV